MILLEGTKGANVSMWENILGECLPLVEIGFWSLLCFLNICILNMNIFIIKTQDD